MCLPTTSKYSVWLRVRGHPSKTCKRSVPRGHASLRLPSNSFGRWQVAIVALRDGETVWDLRSNRREPRRFSVFNHSDKPVGRGCVRPACGDAHPRLLYRQKVHCIYKAVPKDLRGQQSIL